MTICNECAYEADAVKNHPNTTHARIAKANRLRVEFWKEPVFGHAACRGGTWCDCAHLDVGTCIPVESDD